jgi:hypothetical protein
MTTAARLILMGLISLTPHVARAANWNEFKTGGSALLFVAFEEAPFAQDRLGKWLPRRLYNVEGLKECFWSLVPVMRKDNQVTVSLMLRGRSESMKLLNFSYFSKGENGELTTEAQHNESEVMIQIHEGTGAPPRRLWFAMRRSVPSLMEEVSVSKSSPLWKWDNIVKLD